jgi:DNA-binding response OmpR family regulator
MNKQMVSDFSILYAEDDLETRENYNLILKQYYKDVYLAQDGQEALELYSVKKPDVVLLDISMPKVDGLSVAKQIRNSDKDTKILMFTAHSNRELLLKAVNLYLDEYLIKPIEIEKFQSIIQNINNKLASKNILKLCCGFIWYFDKKELYYDGNLVKITKKENIMLNALCSNTNKYFTMDQLSKVLWDEEPSIEHYNRIKQLISRFKSKISNVCGKSDALIENSYSYGYKIKLY